MNINYDWWIFQRDTAPDIGTYQENLLKKVSSISSAVLFLFPLFFLSFFSILGQEKPSTLITLILSLIFILSAGLSLYLLRTHRAKWALIVGIVVLQAILIFDNLLYIPEGLTEEALLADLAGFIILALISALFFKPPYLFLLSILNILTIVALELIEPTARFRAPLIILAIIIITLLIAVFQRANRIFQETTLRNAMLLSSSQAFIENVFDSIGHPFYVVRAKDYKIVLSNPASGIRKPDQYCYELSHRRSTPCDGIDHPCPLREILKTRRGVTLEHTHYDEAGHQRIVEVHGYPMVGDDGSIEGIIEYSLDITERKRAEKEKEQARNAAEAANHLKSSILSNLPHELRTPLNHMLGFIHLLETGRLTKEENEEYLKIIGQSTQRLSRRIDDLLEIAGIETGKRAGTKVPYDLAKLLEKLIQDAEHNLFSEGKSIVLSSSIDASLATKVYGDVDSIELVVQKILDNAVKFTKDGSIRCDATLPEDKPGFFLLAVTDTGIGMTEDQIRLSFESFVQGDRGLSRSYGGLGLGLAISRKYVELMGGTMEIQSLVGEGTRVSVFLPYEPSDH
jgi:nitrogen-specific signal transduction histidine kinase